MAERAANHVPLPHADEIVDDQTVTNAVEQPAAQQRHADAVPRLAPPVRHPKQNVRVPDVRLAEHAAPAVPGALRLRARRGLEVVDEPADEAVLDQARTTRRN